MKKICNLKPEDLNCNIFSCYDYDGLSLQELLCQFFTKIEECIEVSNNALEFLEWLKEQGLKEEVVLQLEQWLEDGTLADIIGDVITTLERRLKYLNPDEDIKEVFKNVPENTTIMLNKCYDVDTLVLKNKRNVTIIGNGCIKQEVAAGQKCSFENPVSTKPTLFIDGCENITIKDISVLSRYESISIFGSTNIIIENCNFKGISGSDFNNILIRESKKIKINGCTIEDHGGIPTYDTSKKESSYAFGNGIGMFLTEDVIIDGNIIEKNGMNGVYGFVTGDIVVANNRIHNNRMSGIQFAWAVEPRIKQTGYTITGNDISYNWSDTIDLNNTIPDQVVDCELTFTGNRCIMNGWFNNDTSKPTQDGSGMTAIKVKNITYVGNTIKDCAGAMLFCHQAENVIADNVWKYTKLIDTNRRPYLMSIEKSKNIKISGLVEDTINNIHGVSFDLYHGDCENIVLDGLNIKCKNFPIFIKEPERLIGTLKNVKAIGCSMYSDNMIVVQTAVDYIGCTFEVSLLTGQEYPILIGEGKAVNGCKFITTNHKLLHPAGNNKFLDCEFITKGSNQSVIIETKNNSFTNCKFSAGTDGTPIILNDGGHDTSFTNCYAEGQRGLQSNVGVQNVYITGGVYKSLTGDNSVRFDGGNVRIFIEPITIGHAEFGPDKKTVQFV